MIRGLVSRRRRDAGELLSSSAVGSSPLACHSEIMRSTGGLEFDPSPQRLIVEPIQHAFVVFRWNHLLSGDVDSTADGDEQECMQRVGAKISRQLKNIRQLTRIVPG